MNKRCPPATNLRLPRVLRWCVTRLIHTDRETDAHDWSWVSNNSVLEGVNAERARDYLMHRECLTWLPTTTAYMTWRIVPTPTKVILLACGPVLTLEGQSFILPRVGRPPLLMGPPGPYMTTADHMPNGDCAYFLLDFLLTPEQKARFAKLLDRPAEMIDDAGYIIEGT